MPLYSIIKRKKLLPVKESIREFVEKDIQTITEQNLEELFYLEFLGSEIQFKNFRIDTLAFDPEAFSSQ